MKSRKDIIYKVCLAEHITKLTFHDFFIQRIETTVSSLKYSTKLQANEEGAFSIEKLNEIAKILDIDVIVEKELSFPDSVDAICFKTTNNGNRKRKIILKGGLSLIKERFALAHELGHMILGHDFIDYNSAILSFPVFRRFIKNEFEANHFAGALLIDRYLLEKDIENGNINLEKLAEKYRVPYETVAHRLVLIAAEEHQLHLLKVDIDGETVRKYGGKSPYGINWLRLEKACKHTAARKIVSNGLESYAQCVVNKDGQKLYCYAKKIVEGGKTYGLAIGTTEKNKDNFSYFKNKEIEEVKICYDKECTCK